MKKPTQRDLIKQDIKEAIESQKGTNITGCTFVGAQFHKSALEAIEAIANGVIQNAIVLQQLASVLKHSNVHIDAMLRIGGDAP